ncbi:NUDIX hydrolase [Actinomadura atramentaria]|uniref:NUDIX hydrolase n=1 Tax=Actinomadura atramentaria TaxID=1990 RepID=UPI0003758612|nr:NUDIX domain-containing protein [Actinomadura atramentaria]
MDEIRAAGVVLWRAGPDGVEIAVAHRPYYDDWSFPKGKVEDGEHVVVAAVRETVEETGVTPHLGRRLTTCRYTVRGRPKRVDYWAAEADGAAFAANDEVDALDWLPPAEAERRLSYPADAALLREFTAGPARTVPLVIVRHGSAGDKRTWRGADELRPLDERGRAEAVALADPLAAFLPPPIPTPGVPPGAPGGLPEGAAPGAGGGVRVVSSATARCVETLLPFARRTGASITTDPVVTVGSGDAETGAALLVRLADARRPAVVCTHGELLTGMLPGLCAALGVPPPQDPALVKGGFWVVHLDAASGGAVGLERHAGR